VIPRWQADSQYCTIQRRMASLSSRLHAPEDKGTKKTQTFKLPDLHEDQIAADT